MALLNILHYPDERLHTVARPVDVVDDALRRLIDDMAETMYAAHGIGLAATQIDYHRRLVVIDLSEEHDDLLVLINPVITRKAGETVYEEGCLSVPGIYDTVTRAEHIKVRALNEKGETIEFEATELLAGDLPITDIALQCGYTDHSAFSRQFKAMTGSTPRDFRITLAG